MRLYRAIGYAELQDILSTGVLRTGPPSYQGKWLAESLAEAAEWGRRLYPGVTFSPDRGRSGRRRRGRVVRPPRPGPDRPGTPKYPTSP